MTVWIFQANPDLFRVGEYLNAVSNRVCWRVSKYRRKIAVGDQVFIWRALGRDHGISGVIAEARVQSAVQVMVDDPASRPFWRDPTNADTEEHRVWLELVRIAKDHEILLRQALLEDLILSSLSIFSYAGTTNHAVKPNEAIRLNELWRQSTRADSGLAQHAASVDPDIALAEADMTSPQSAQLAEKSEQDLFGIYNRLLQEAQMRTANVISRTTTTFERALIVVHLAKHRAQYRCEIPGCDVQTFLTNRGDQYCEVHHIVPLSEQGQDTIENVAVVYPSHHRELHFGKEREGLRDQLVRLRAVQK